MLAKYKAATGERLDPYEPLDPSHPLEFSTAFIEAVSAIPGLPVPEQPNPYGAPGTSASLSGQSTVNPTMVGEPVDPRPMGLGASHTPQIPAHTGHFKDDIPTGLGPNDRVPESPGLQNLVPSDTAHRDNEEPYISNVFAAKAGEIPGVDIPFRKVNPKFPANQDVLSKSRALRKYVLREENKHYDCSEIAKDLQKAANGKGRIIEVLPAKGKTLDLYEFGKTEPGFTYHQVYTDGQYVYDSRLSSEAIPKGDWEIMIRSLNKDAKFQYKN